MNEQKKQEQQLNSIFSGLQKEVGAESAPLLQFITRHAGSIAGVVILLLLAVIGMGIWDWHQNKVMDEAQTEMARLMSQLTGKERVSALQNLAESAPSSMRLYIYLALAESALTSGDREVAQNAYARAAELDEGGSIGVAAVLGHANSLLNSGNFAAGLALLEKIQSEAPVIASTPQFREILANAAARGGKPALAYQIWESLARESQGAEAGYFQSKAEEIGARLENNTTAN